MHMLSLKTSFDFFHSSWPTSRRIFFFSTHIFFVNSSIFIPRLSCFNILIVISPVPFFKEKKASIKWCTLNILFYPYQPRMWKHDHQISDLSFFSLYFFVFKTKYFNLQFLQCFFYCFSLSSMLLCVNCLIHCFKQVHDYTINHCLHAHFPH